MSVTDHSPEWFPGVVQGVIGCEWQTLCQEVGSDLGAESVHSSLFQRDFGTPLPLLIEDECRRIAEVYAAGLRQCAGTLRRMLNNLELDSYSASQLPRDALDAAVIKVLHLDSFYVMNEITLQSMFNSRLPHVQWGAIARQLLESRTDPSHGSIVLSTSRLYRHKQAIDEGKGQWVPPDVFERSCTKYYVPPHQAFRMKLYWCRVIPVLQYRQAATQDDDLLTSCYYDSPELDLYEQRLQRLDMAQLLRVRWYGELTEDSRIFVETKTHRSKSSGEKSTKERFPLLSTQLDAFMAGRWSPEHYFNAVAASQEQCDKWVAIATRAQQLVKTYSLQPRVLTVYRRTAFQDWRTNAVRVSLDTDLKMVFLRNKATSSWLGAPNGIPGDALPGDVFTVPWAILEVKLAGPPDPLVQQAITDMEAAIQPAGKFSKFLTGMAVHYSEQVEEQPCWWDEPKMAAAIKDHRFLATPGVPALQRGETSDSSFIGRQTTIELQPTTPKLLLPPTQDNVRGHSPSPSVGSVPSQVPLDLTIGRLSPGRSKPSRISLPCSWRCRPCRTPEKKSTRKRTDAKCHFANERTFIQWLSTGVLLATLSAGLVEINSIMGFWLMPVALLIAAYSLLRYYLRTRALVRGINTGIQDLYGPVLLAVAVIVAISVSFSMAVHKSSESSASSAETSSPMPSLRTVTSTLPFELNPLLGSIRGLAHVNSSMMLAVGAGYLCELHLDTFSHHIEWLPSYKFTSIAVLNASDALLLSESPPRLIRYDFVTRNTKAMIDLHCMPPASLQSMVPMWNLSLHSTPANFLLIGGANGALHLLRSPPSFAFGNSTACEYVPLDPLLVLSTLEMELKAAWVSFNDVQVTNSFQMTPATASNMNLGCRAAACQELSLETSRSPLRQAAGPQGQMAFHLQSPAVLAFASITSVVGHAGESVVDLLFADLQTVVKVDLAKGVTLGRYRIPLGPDQRAIAMTYTPHNAYYSIVSPIGLIAIKLPE